METKEQTKLQLVVDSLLSPKEVAELLGVSVNAIYLWAKTNRLPCIMIGKSVRFQPNLIKKIMNGTYRI